MRAIVSLIVLVLLGGCESTEGKRADRSVCTFAYQAFSDAIAKSGVAESPLDEANALSRAEMNLDILLAKDCCRFADLCPAGVMAP